MSGKQYRESSGSTNKRAAEKLLAMRQTQLFEDRWSLPKSQAPKFSEFAKEFLDSIQHDNTRARYESSIHNLHKYFGSNIRLSEITAERIFAFQH
ncbi:MAG: hypothetical protein M3O09_05170, partial [Acidobacteriota bacterium]|nr:hypothetical protein [Acidobacteriota bacterium]